MSTQAHVESVAALEAFRAALAAYESRMQTALDTLTAEVRRAEGWVDYDAPHYWKEQEKKASDAVLQARLELERCLMFPVANEKPACREEKALLRKAQDRLDYCRQKREIVKHWQSQLSHEMFEFDGRLGHLKRVLESELPAARAKLQQIIRSIEGYQIERAPGSVATASQAGDSPTNVAPADGKEPPTDGHHQESEEDTIE